MHPNKLISRSIEDSGTGESIRWERAACEMGNQSLCFGRSTDRSVGWLVGLGAEHRRSRFFNSRRFLSVAAAFVFERRLPTSDIFMHSRRAPSHLTSFSTRSIHRPTRRQSQSKTPSTHRPRPPQTRRRQHAPSSSATQALEPRASSLEPAPPVCVGDGQQHRDIGAGGLAGR